MKPAILIASHDLEIVFNALHWGNFVRQEGNESFYQLVREADRAVSF